MINIAYSGEGLGGILVVYDLVAAQRLLLHAYGYRSDVELMDEAGNRYSMDSTTPIEEAVSDEEEGDGDSGVVCTARPPILDLTTRENFFIPRITDATGKEVEIVTAKVAADDDVLLEEGLLFTIVDDEDRFTGKVFITEEILGQIAEYTNSPFTFAEQYHIAQTAEVDDPDDDR